MRTTALAGCLAGIGLVVFGISPANAQGGTTTAPGPIVISPSAITISPAQIQQLCQQVPSLKSEVGQLITWINGDANTVGSTQWLQAQAAQAKANNHAARAEVLAGRAESRGGVLIELQHLQTRVDEFAGKYCGGGE